MQPIMPGRPSAPRPIYNDVARKVAWRFLPFLGILQFVNFFDRVSLSFAGPGGMNDDLGLTASMFGLAAGLFFIGYVIFEIPSNLALYRFGAKLWLARIVVTWGIAQTLTAFVTNEMWLYVLRFLLGVAEGGFVPGIVFFLATWFPRNRRGWAIGLFLVAAPVSAIIGAPLATALMDIGDRVFEIAGWRFLFLASGIPAILLGVMTYFFLADRPQDVGWLNEEDKEVIEEALQADAESTDQVETSLREILRLPALWIFSFGCFTAFFSAYSLTFFLPTIVNGFEKRFGTTYTVYESSLLVAIPFAALAATIIIVGRGVDRRAHGARYLLVLGVTGAIGAVIAAIANGPFMLLFSLALLAAAGATPTLVFVAVTRMFSGRGAASGIAVVTLLGGVGGFVGPVMFGKLLDLTGTSSAGLFLIAILLVVSNGMAAHAHRILDRNETHSDNSNESLSKGTS